MLIAAGLILVFGCGPPARVRPAGAEGTSVALTDPGAPVQVRIDTGAWRGRPSPLHAVLPVQIRIENQSEHAIQVSPASVLLRFEDGQRLAATPAATLESEERIEPGLGSDATRLLGGYDFEDSHTWPGYLPLGSGVSPGEAPLVVEGVEQDPEPLLLTIPLPTLDMLEAELQPQTLAPGERIVGFVYFEGVPADAEWADLEVPLEDASVTARLRF